MGDTDTISSEVFLAHFQGLARRLDDMKEDVRNLKTSIENSQKNSVPRGEWSQRNEHVDARFNDQGREIAQLRAEITALETQLDNERTPASTIVSGGLAALALGWAIFGPILSNGG